MSKPAQPSGGSKVSGERRCKDKAMVGGGEEEEINSGTNTHPTYHQADCFFTKRQTNRDDIGEELNNSKQMLHSQVS